jgi:hypothetical protein
MEKIVRHLICALFTSIDKQFWGVGSFEKCHFFFPLAPLLGSSFPYWRTRLITQFLDLSQVVGLLGRVISSSQGLYLNTGQHKHRKTRTHIKLPCSGGIRTRNHGLRAIEDSSCLRPLGYRDRGKLLLLCR